MLGGEAENLSPLPNWEQLPKKHISFSKPLKLRPPRVISCFLLGLLTLIADLLNGISIHLHRWSSFPPTPIDEFYYRNFSLS
ncbi:MAG: transposase [Nostoc sp. NMS1]|nr:transposase [Nostoc sp. NMS1]MBN3989782.1 transposase [Nostoc sp. NMS2]